jgi:hypothetical protein
MTQLPAQILTATKHRDAPRLTGYIDAITEDRIFGWAWDPQQADTRLAIRVEVDGKAVATAVADQPREDLASNGVGDGGHAFEIVLAPGITPEKITVFALGSETGERLELTHRPLAGALAADSRSEELRGVVHALCRSQRLLSGKVQTVVDAIQSLKNDDAAKVAEGSHSSRLDALEVAVARMDERLREHGHSIDALKQRPQDQISRVLSYAALAVAGAALVISMTW